MEDFDTVVWKETSGVAHAAYRAVDDQSPIYDHEWVTVVDAVLRAEGWHLLRTDIRELVNMAPVERAILQEEAHKASARRASAIGTRKLRHGNVKKLLKGEYKLGGIRPTCLTAPALLFPANWLCSSPRAFCACRSTPTRIRPRQ